MKAVYLSLLVLFSFNTTFGQEYKVCNCDTFTEEDCGNIPNPRYCFYTDNSVPDSLVTPDFIYRIIPQAKDTGKSIKVPFYRHQFYVEIPEKAGMVDLRLYGARVRCTFESGITPVLLLPSTDFQAFTIVIKKGKRIWDISFPGPDKEPLVFGL